MATLLSIDSVQYECSCGEWGSLNRLYFCRHCSVLRCSYCVSEEMDSTFCPSCLDNVSTGEARLKKNRCPNCYQCPLCGVGVVVRTANEAYHLSCNTCRWTTVDSGVPDLASSTGWPEYTNRDEELLSSFLERMRNFAAVERAERERHKYTKRRSNLGVFSDRFGLQAIYNRRKAALSERSTIPTPVLEASDSVPELEDSIFSETTAGEYSLPTLMQQMGQPLAAGRPLMPAKTHLVGRRAVRCKQCDHSLCKGEYSPNSVKFKIQVLAGNYVPDVRLSRAPSLIAGQWCPVFLTVSNFSSSVTQMILVPDEIEDPSYVKCETPAIELTIANRDETMEVDDTIEKYTAAASGAIVFRKRHQAGLRMAVMADEGHGKLLGLIVKYTNSGISFEPGTENIWLVHKIRIKLGDSPLIESHE